MFFFRESHVFASWRVATNRDRTNHKSHHLAVSVVALLPYLQNFTHFLRMLFFPVLPVLISATNAHELACAWS